jgi:primosomal protein N' (replication factor Y)
MYAEVLVQYGVKSLDHTFTYHIPDSLVNELTIGMKVFVPFGRQSINGFVTNIISNKTDIEDIEIKDILSIVTKELKLNKELLSLGEYISESVLCTKIAAYQTMLPTSLKINNSKETYELKRKIIYINKDISIIEDYISKNKRAKCQIDTLEYLIENGDTLKSSLNTSAVKKLLELDLVGERLESIFRINPGIAIEEENNLNEEQEKAYKEIISSMDSANTYLLHGVTGSGKTEVYMHLVSNVIKNNKNAIILVPEISLTTQIVKRFYERFGDDVAIFHSNLSDGEKFDEYKKIESGKVHIVVGTRSAIFVPFKNIGIIIIDEEHSPNYKQDNNPRYHAINIAKWRSNYHNCPLVLGTATPSLETMARAEKGLYKYLPLTKRIGKSTLPKIEIVDMQKEFKKKNMILSDRLQLEIMHTLEKHEQVMILLNRRGYSTIVTCVSCGFTYKCPNCDITLTYHKTNNHLRCHYCGYTVINSSICPNCHEDAIRDYGMGTEKLESYIKDLYPSYNIVRMDADTTSRKGSHEKIINDIEQHKYDIIIGTQMISKGFDFKDVTLVGIVNADESLNIPDFRSGENTFSLLSQVSGRAGRGELSGLVILQTFNPDNKTLQYVMKHDYMSNYKYEMDIRRKLKYPPYYYLVVLRITSKNYSVCSKEATKVCDYLRKNLDKSTIVLGPTTASIFKVNNIYRFQIVIKYRFDDNLFTTLKFIDNQYIMNRDINIELDIDPIRI